VTEAAATEAATEPAVAEPATEPAATEPQAPPEAVSLQTKNFVSIQKRKPLAPPARRLRRQQELQDSFGEFCFLFDLRIRPHSRAYIVWLYFYTHTESFDSRVCDVVSVFL